MRKENVFPTRRSVVPTLSLNKSNVYLNNLFGKTFYPKSLNKPLWVIYVKKGKKFYLLVSKVKKEGMKPFSVLYENYHQRSYVGTYYFQELKSSDVARYECIPVKSDLKGIDVYELKPYAFDSVKSLEFFNFKILK